MSRFRAFIVPFNQDGTYGTEQEITSDVNFSSISAVKQQLDNNQYNVGVLTYNDFNLKLRNEHGHYSQVGEVNSIFNIKRNDSIFRLYWQIDSFLPICGVAVCGTAQLSEVKLVYEGFIRDDSTSESPRDKAIKLKVLSLESIFSQVEVPNGVISNLDSFEDAFYAILNQTLITNLFTVDVANFDLAFDSTIDDALALASQDGKNAIDELLLLSNSIIYIKDRVIYISGRVASATSQYTFYGPASRLGLENIQNLLNIRTGISKSFNYWTWRDETFNVQDATNKALYGVRRKQIDSNVITITAKRQAVLGELATEFGTPKRYFKIKTPLNYETIELFFLDKVNVDYPTVYFAAEGRNLPFYGIAQYDQDYYPIPEDFMTIDVNTNWRVMARNIDVKSQLLEFELREV